MNYLLVIALLQALPAPPRVLGVDGELALTMEGSELRETICAVDAVGMQCEPLVGPDRSLVPLACVPVELSACPGNAWQLQATVEHHGTYTTQLKLEGTDGALVVPMSVNRPHAAEAKLLARTGGDVSAVGHPFSTTAAAHQVELLDEAGVGGPLQSRVLRVRRGDLEYPTAGLSASVAGSVPIGRAALREVRLAGLPGAGSWEALVRLGASTGEAVDVALTTQVRHHWAWALVAMSLGLLTSRGVWWLLHRHRPLRKRQRRLAALEVALDEEQHAAIGNLEGRPALLAAVRTRLPDDATAEAPLCEAETSWAAYRAWVVAAQQVATLPPAAVSEGLRASLDAVPAALFGGLSTDEIERASKKLGDVQSGVRAALRGWLGGQATAWKERLDYADAHATEPLPGVQNGLRLAHSRLQTALNRDALAEAQAAEQDLARSWAELMAERIRRASRQLDDSATKVLDDLLQQFVQAQGEARLQAASHLQRQWVRLAVDHVAGEAAARRRAHLREDPEEVAYQDARLAAAAAVRARLGEGALEAADRQLSELLSMGDSRSVTRNAGAAAAALVGLFSVSGTGRVIDLMIPRKLRDPQRIDELYEGLLLLVVALVLVMTGLQDQWASNPTWGEPGDYAKAVSWGFGLHFLSQGGLTAWAMRQLKGEDR